MGTSGPKKIELDLIKSDSHEHGGYGAGSGEEIRIEYKCPCGNGRVVYEKDDIPGFKESFTYCYCKECDEKYDFHRGTATDKK